MSRILGKDSHLLAVPSMEEICKPLKHFEITNFIYVKNYENGQFVHLTNRGDWLEHFYDQGLYKVGSLHKKGSVFNPGFLFWETLSGQDVVRIARRDFSMFYGILLIERDAEGFFEFYAFSGSREARPLYDFYINNGDVLRRFILYFKDVGRDILQRVEKDRIQLPKEDQLFLNGGPTTHRRIHSVVPDIEKLRKVFVLDTKIKRYRIQLEGLKEVDLSGRELDIVLCLWNAMGLVEMSEKLHISNRTVEKHLERLKRKFDCGTTICLKKKIVKAWLHGAQNRSGILF